MYTSVCITKHFTCTEYLSGVALVEERLSPTWFEVGTSFTLGIMYFV